MMDEDSRYVHEKLDKILDKIEGMKIECGQRKVRSIRLEEDVDKLGKRIRRERAVEVGTGKWVTFFEFVAAAPAAIRILLSVAVFLLSAFGITIGIGRWGQHSQH